MITLKELAKKLEVSVSTVSKALNDSPEISDSTRDRVKKIASYYNYKPNRIALSLKNSSTKTIGVIIPNILNPFFAKVLYGIEKEATSKGYQIITCISNESLSSEINNIKLLDNGSVDGFILALSEETQIKNAIDHVKKLVKTKMPLVMFDRVSEDIDCDKIIIDDFKAAYNATHFLIKKKRKTIALMSTINNLSVGKLRVEGYKKALTDNGLLFNSALLLNLQTPEKAYSQIEKHLNTHKAIDGVLAIDNASGIMAVNIASSLGKSIPKDISVIGFANEIQSNYSSPNLTIVNQHAEAIGKKSFDYLLKQLESKTPSKSYRTKIVETTIEERGTT